MAPTRVITLDLNFQGRPHAIAAFLIRHNDGAILIESGTPVLYRQRRMGLEGREFDVLKFRSMVKGAEKRSDEVIRRDENGKLVYKRRNDQDKQHGHDGGGGHQQANLA